MSLLLCEPSRQQQQHYQDRSSTAAPAAALLGSSDADLTAQANHRPTQQQVRGCTAVGIVADHLQQYLQALLTAPVVLG